MIEEMIDNQWEAMRNIPMPNQRFFTPTEAFWMALTDYSDEFRMIVDCGTGNGELPEEAIDRGIRMGGCDICPREGNGPMRVHIVPAHLMTFDKMIWPMVCRPSHGPWVQHLFDISRESGSGFIYVGLFKNLIVDLDMIHEPPYETIHDAGDDGEVMIVWKPRPGNTTNSD